MPAAPAAPAVPTETRKFRFRVGDRVEWTQHGAHKGGHGVVKSIANPEGTWLEVEFDVDGDHETAGGLKGTAGDTLVLTEDELRHSDEPVAE